jgi:ABC-type amino acid transport substrate-binding protein
MTDDELERRLRSDAAGERPFDLGGLSRRILEDGAARRGPIRGPVRWRRPPGTLAAAVVVVFVVVAVVRLAPGPHVAALPSEIVRSGQLRFAVTDGSPQLEATGRPQGFDIDVANEIAERLSLRAQVDLINPARIAAGSWTDRWDVALGTDALSPVVDAGLAAGSPYYYRAAAIVVHASESRLDLAALTGHDLCVVSGSLAETWLGGAVVSTRQIAPPASPRIRSADTLGACLDAVRAGSADAAVVDFGYDVADPGTDLIVLPIHPWSVAGVPLVDRSLSASADLLAVVSRTVDDMRKDGTLRELAAHRFGGLDLSVPP